MALPSTRRSGSRAAVPSARWDPFREFQELQAATGQLLEEIVSSTEGGPFVPPVDIEETEDAWVIEAELPGVDKDDIDVDFREGELTISGEIKERERKGILRRKTRRVGRFEFRVSVPGGADPEQVEAKLDNGVLTVRIPKPETSRPRKIEVTTGAS